MRVKRGVAAHKKHKKIRQSTKGMTHAHTASVRRGRQAVVRSLQNSYRDRRNRKRTFRSLWNVRINAAARDNGTTYSKLIASLKKASIELDRKILSELATNEPKSFTEIVKKAK